MGWRTLIRLLLRVVQAAGPAPKYVLDLGHAYTHIQEGSLLLLSTANLALSPTVGQGGWGRLTIAVSGHTVGPNFAQDWVWSGEVEVISRNRPPCISVAAPLA